MKTIIRIFLLAATAMVCQIGATSCSTTLAGNELGSQPVNDKEAIKYRQAIVRCYKTGGNRVVKIMGKLRCF